MLHGHITQDMYIKCQEYHVKNYPVWWNRMVEEWTSGQYDHHLWVAGSSSYFVRLRNVLWAVDPVWLMPGTFQAIEDRLEKDLQTLDFILITHEHDDHFRPNFAHKLRNLPIRWIAPRCMEEQLLDAGIPEENCSFLDPGDVVTIRDVQIRAYQGHHHYSDGRKGPESLMYAVHTTDECILFPADMRSFRAEYIPAGVHYNTIVLHMYLSSNSSYEYPYDGYYQELVSFVADLDTDQLFIGHLYGLHCAQPNHLWNFSHVGMLEDGIFYQRPELPIVPLKIGKRHSILKDNERNTVDL